MPILRFLRTELAANAVMGREGVISRRCAQGRVRGLSKLLIRPSLSRSGATVYAHNATSKEKPALRGQAALWLHFGQAIFCQTTSFPSSGFRQGLRASK